MSGGNGLGNTTCSKGHIHPPWNTTGVLRIAKCESICGFCQKETKTAANLRKHVAIHVKNDGLNLTVAEGSSGRGRLEMPSRNNNNASRVSPPNRSDEDTPSPSRSYSRSLKTQRERFSPSAVLLSMASNPHSHSPSSSSSTSSTLRYTYPTSSGPSSASHLAPHSVPITYYPSTPPDPFRPLRHHNIPTKSAWTPIPSSEGFRILDYCKALSSSDSKDRVPCYNREIIFDEEWQAHMKDVHGVYLLWPETWMRRIEVLDLDAFGGDIGACNEVIMDS